ncbi:hypothetical protein D046_1550, partial [Vibrio parahaemolyticus V-223/04]|jgi:hypothetical protein
MNNI